MVIGVNPAFTKILEKRGLLYDVFNPSKVVKYKTAYDESESSNDDNDEYYDDML